MEHIKTKELQQLWFLISLYIEAVLNATPWPLELRGRTPLPIVQEAGWKPLSIWREVEERKPLAPPG
jgi:hypothetical protein